MRFHRRYFFPKLLALLSAPAPPVFGRWAFQSRPSAGRLQQLIGLAREGLREYDDRLDTLDRNALNSRWEDDSQASIHCEANPEPDSCWLSELQIQHIFERLAIRRCMLNTRGFPYTSDVNEERERLYIESESIGREDVENAWHDWRNDDGKRLFLRHDCEADREAEFEFEEAPLKEVERDHLFRAFDEIVLTSGDCAARFGDDGIPPLSVVNRFLREHFEMRLVDENALRSEWMMYLVVAASARTQYTDVRWEEPCAEPVRGGRNQRKRKLT